MTSTLAIGDFSRATHLSLKILRPYHEIGLLEPVDVDADTGYRRYATGQIVAAQIIRRYDPAQRWLRDTIRSAAPAAPECHRRTRFKRVQAPRSQHQGNSNV